MRLVDYTLKVLGLSEAMRKWHDLLAALDQSQRDKIARFAEQIAGTLARATEAFERIEKNPGETAAKRAAIRELGRLSGYVENIVVTLEGRVDGRRLNGLKRRLEALTEDGLIADTVRKADAARIDRLLASEGYFRALADALRA
jgi:ABC-type transporter Mla subunit MlaD